MTRVTLAHDYFLQMGGAERVAATWMSHYPESKIYTMAYAPDATFSSIEAPRVQAILHGNLWAKHLHKFLPLLPTIAKKVLVDEGDVALLSTSGWAHQFQYDIPTVAYVHSPARWLYAAEDYRMGLSKIPRTGLRISESYLKTIDIPAMKRMDKVISNSKVTQQRIWSAYGLESQVIFPPVEKLRAEAMRPTTTVPNGFLLIVARNRGYKRLQAAASVARGARRALVVIGSGTQEMHDPDSGVYGLGRTTDSELRWLYQKADALLATAREDFGLTVLEANAEGTPVVAIPAGGYLETVQSGVNGVLAASEDIESFPPALEEALTISPDSCQQWAAKFSTTNHMDKLKSVINDVTA